MKSYVQVLGAGTPDGGGPAILIFFDEERYLINCGEGLQRFCGEHRIKLGKLSHIMLSRLSWDCAGGIPGLISTLADAGAANKLQIVGPRNTKHAIAAMRPFLHRANYSVSIDELGPDNKSYSDKNLNVRIVELFEKKEAEVSSPEQKRRKSDGIDGTNLKEIGVENLDMVITQSNHFLLKMFKDPAKYGTNVPEATLSCREHYHQIENERMTQFSRLPTVMPTKSSLCYIIEGPQIPGRFLSQVAKSLGVPHGPMNGRLQKGETVELPDGTLVTPEMCIGPAVPGPIMVYFDVSTIDHAHDLMGKLGEYSELTATGSRADQVKLVIHYVPCNIYESDLYKKGKFLDWPAHCHHVHIEASMQLSLESPSLILGTLGTELGSHVYPLPYGKASIGTANQLTKFTWINTAKAQKFEDSAEADALRARLPLECLVPSNSSPSNDVEVTVLGTGAALPGKYRNVSSTLVTSRNKTSVLFDCGEATTGQIMRSHGTNFETVLKTIKLIFISHLHADHHAGLLGLLEARAKHGLSSQELTIIGPQRYKIWLEEYSECTDIGTFEYVSCESIIESSYMSSELELLAVPVEHCPRSFACIVTIDGSKIVFSGDTRPCNALIDAGMNSDLLIHEATMGDDLQAEAIAKRHCTITEAIDVGRAMKAKHIMLTHFSQRYSKSAPPIPEDAHNVSVAFDLMRVSLGQIHEIEGHAYNERIRQLLPEEDGPTDNQAE